MTPYYSDDSTQLYLGDSREILPALGLTADVIIADPPYQSTELDWDEWPTGWLDTVSAHSNALWCFGSMRTLTDHWPEFGDAGWRYSHDVIWEKDQGSSGRADRFKCVHEIATLWYQGPWGEVYKDVPRIPAHNPADIRVNRPRSLQGWKHTAPPRSRPPCCGTWSPTRARRAV